MIAIVSISIRQLKFSEIRGGLRCFLALSLIHTHSHTLIHTLTHAHTHIHTRTHTRILAHKYTFCNILISFPETVERHFLKRQLQSEKKIELYDFRLLSFSLSHFFYFIFSILLQLSENWKMIFLQTDQKVQISDYFTVFTSKTL